MKFKFKIKINEMYVSGLLVLYIFISFAVRSAVDISILSFPFFKNIGIAGIILYVSLIIIAFALIIPIYLLFKRIYNEFVKSLFLLQKPSKILSFGSFFLFYLSPFILASFMANDLLKELSVKFSLSIDNNYSVVLSIFVLIIYDYISRIINGKIGIKSYFASEKN